MSKENPTEMERLIVKKFLRDELKFKDAHVALGITQASFAFLVAFTARTFVEEFKSSTKEKDLKDFLIPTSEIEVTTTDIFDHTLTKGQKLEFKNFPFIKNKRYEVIDTLPGVGGTTVAKLKEIHL